MGIWSKETPPPTILHPGDQSPTSPLSGRVEVLEEVAKGTKHPYHDSPWVEGSLVRAEVGWDVGYILFPSLLPQASSFHIVMGVGATPV